MAHCLVFDIGKTHIKWHVLDSALNTLHVEQCSNHVENNGPYPHFDLDAIWAKFVTTTKAITRQTQISRLCVTTHGATAALIDRSNSDNGLVTPLLDYEFEDIESVNDAYNKVRPDFSETASPNLPAGLNLGRQLFWLQQRHADRFEKATDILLYPQYWVWRLTGKLCSEVTSLGCHTDLWNPHKNTLSSLVFRCEWATKFPELRPAWGNTGTINSKVAAATGLPTHCEMYVGVHDSNASYLRQKTSTKGKPFSIISTGTWSIVMDSKGDLSCLDEHKDMLANVDVWGNPVICSRFMGGREYGKICEYLSGDLDEPFKESDLATLITNEVFCLPNWQAGSGPFSENKPSIENPNNALIVPSALASLYCALTLDHQLDLVRSSDDIIISGAFLKNALLCKILAQLRAPQIVLASTDDTGTVMGAAQLTQWGHLHPELPTHAISPTQIVFLNEYKKCWTQKVMSTLHK